MGYYMRFIVEDDTPLTLEVVDSALKTYDAQYAIRDGGLYFEEDIYGEIEINKHGEELCNAELQELREFVEDAAVGQQDRVLENLREAKCMVVLRVLSQGRDTDSTLKVLDPLWEWLFTYRRGLLQADGEGYYDVDGLILNVA
ncbi:hypothetical protein OAS39_04175 [Pirellulales bacterium]|nr:hypothetical protein [Pirellulales bacterium]